MKALQAYIDKHNRWNSLFSGNVVVYEVKTADGRRRVAQSIDAALSPENLTCDGELSRTEVNRRYKELTSAAKDLIKLDPSVSQYMYEFSE
jgi:hypothetical protein